MNGDFAQHVDEENRSAQSMTPDPIPPNVDPVQWLIDRVQGVIAESVQMGTEPLSTKAGVLAQLYQAQALRQIASSMEDLYGALSHIGACLDSGNPNPRHIRRRHQFNRRNPSRFAQIFRDMADAYEDLEK